MITDTTKITETTKQLNVPYFRPDITDLEVDEVVECLQSGWLTTGPRTKKFESCFANTVKAKYAVATNSCTSALHLAVEALELQSRQAVLVPTMTFASTGEIVIYQGAIPILVDCDPRTLNMDLKDAEQKINDLKNGKLLPGYDLDVVGIIPVHVGGDMMNMSKVKSFAAKHNLWVVEDAAHGLPAAYRNGSDEPWTRAGQGTSDVTCFSFYANKTITTGEGGMAVTNDEKLAQRMRQMSLHGLSNDAWKRYSGGRSWDYRIIAPGFKYNMTDLAASIGLHQLDRAESLRRERKVIAKHYRLALADINAIELPTLRRNRIHSWHLFPIRLRLEMLTKERNEYIEILKERGVGCSVHWRPLHLHDYYEDTFGWKPEHNPVATAEWERVISLPIFPGMTTQEQEHVVNVMHDLFNS